MKNILHISDIHASDIPGVGNGAADLKLLTSKIIDDMVSVAKPDTIIITGDIAYSGQCDQYELFFDLLLDPVLRALKIGMDRVVILPGNHDANRKAWKNSNSLIRDQLSDHHSSKKVDDQISEYLEGDFKLFSGFTSLVEKVDRVKSSKPLLTTSLYRAYDIDGVGVACVNTAWLAYKEDRGKLMIGERQILDLINSMNSRTPKILLMHHPLEWLHAEDRKVVSEILYRSKISCMFYGHMHEFSVGKESHFDEDSLLKIQTGKLDIERDGTVTGYCLLSLNEENNFEDGRVYFRKWNSKASAFEAWTERANKGVLDFSIKDAIPFDASRFSDICRSKRYFIERDLLCNVGLAYEQQKTLTDVFVCPSLAWDVGPTTEPDGKAKFAYKKNKSLNLDSIISLSDSLVLLGGENSGKSTLAKRIAIFCLNAQSEGDLSKIFYYVDAKERILNKANKIRDGLLGFYFDDNDGSSCKAKIERKLINRNAIILIDSCEHLDASSIKAVFDYIASNPKPRYILCAQLSARAVLSEFSTRISDSKKFKFLKVSGLKRSHIRELFGNWSPSSRGKNFHAVNQAIRSITGAGMPSNPFVYTMLLSIKERKSTTYRTFMHEADLIENFIEIILEKHVLTTRNDPQYKDLLLFVGYVAAKMQRSDLFSLTETEMAVAVGDFNKLIIKNFSYNGYVGPLVKCGIFRNGDGKYIFSQACFFNYALAHWLIKNNIDYKTIENQIDFLSFDKVFEYVSAIKKSDFELLNHLNARVNCAWNALIENERLVEIGTIDAEINGCVSHDFIDLIKDEALEKEIGDHARTQEAVDDELDEISPLRTEAVSEIEGKKVGNIIPSVAFNEALSLYARAFRAAEHLMNADLSMSHFSSIFDFYMKSASLNVRIFDQRLRSVAISKIFRILDYDNLSDQNKVVAKSQVNAFLNFVISAIPNWSVAMMNSDFFNQRQLERMELYRDKCGSNLEKLLLTYSLCELEGVDIVREISKQKYVKPYESSSLVMKVIELINFSFSISAAEKKGLDDFVRKILKDRKNRKLLANLSILSNKIHGSGEMDSMDFDVITPDD